MDEQNKKQDPPQAHVSVRVNTQVLTGAVLVGVFMIKTNRRLRVVLGNQKVIYDGLQAINDNVLQLASDSITVRDIVKLSAQAINETKGA